MKPTKNRDKNVSSNALLAVAAVLVLGLIAYVWLQRNEPPDSDSATVLQAQVATLSPSQFTGRTAEAYQAAKEIPEVLAQMPCYCGCMQHSGHQHNLHCFVDDHGTACQMCQDIALDAKQLHQEGLPVARIREEIRAKYSKYAP